MKAVTVSLMKWGVNPLLISGIFPVHILSPRQFRVPVPFQPQPQPQLPGVPALARRWPHHIVAPNGATVDRQQVPCMSGSPWWILSRIWVSSVLCSVFCTIVFFFLLFILWCDWEQSSSDGACTDGWMGRGRPSGTTSSWPCTRGKLRGWNASPCPQGKCV